METRKLLKNTLEGMKGAAYFKAEIEREKSSIFGTYIMSGLGLAFETYGIIEMIYALSSEGRNISLAIVGGGTYVLGRIGGMVANKLRNKHKSRISELETKLEEDK